MHQPTVSSAMPTHADAPSIRPPSAPQASPDAPAMHAAGRGVQDGARTTTAITETSSPAASGFTSHAELPAGPSPAILSEEDRVVGALGTGTVPVTSNGGSDAGLNASVVCSNSNGNFPAAAPGVDKDAPHMLSGRPQADSGTASQASQPIPPLPPPELASAPRSAAAARSQGPPSSISASEQEQLPHETLAAPLAEADMAIHPRSSTEPRAPLPKRKPRERRVPASPFGRVMGFAGLGASLVAGTVRDSVAGYFQPRPADGEKPASAVSACHNTQMCTFLCVHFDCKAMMHAVTCGVV